jgi:hypothetical protein
MTLIVVLCGFLVSTLGLAGVFSPRRLLAVVTHTQSMLGPYFIAGLRLLIGTALLLTAPRSRVPLYLTVLGALSLVSGAITPLVGARRFEVILSWWRARPDWVVRLWSAFVLVFGLSLVWAVFPSAC